MNFNEENQNYHLNVKEDVCVFKMGIKLMWHFDSTEYTEI